MVIGHLSLRRYLDKLDFPVSILRENSGIESIPSATREELEYLISLGRVFAVGTYSKVKKLYSTIEEDELADRIEKDRLQVAHAQPPRDLLQKMVSSRKNTYMERIDVVRGNVARRFLITQHKGVVIR